MKKNENAENDCYRFANPVAEELKKYMFSFMVEKEWDMCNVPEQLRSLFVSLCLIANIDADTGICDRLLNDLYQESGLEGQVPYDAFDLFMCATIS